MWGRSCWKWSREGFGQWWKLRAGCSAWSWAGWREMMVVMGAPSAARGPGKGNNLWRGEEGILFSRWGKHILREGFWSGSFKGKNHTFCSYFSLNWTFPALPSKPIWLGRLETHCQLQRNHLGQEKFLSGKSSWVVPRSLAFQLQTFSGIKANQPFSDNSSNRYLCRESSL